MGKTTIAAAVALAVGRRGRRVAVIEFGNESITARCGLPPAGYEGQVIAPGVTAFNITPRPAFREYAARELHSTRLYSLLLDNRFVHYFLDATPGLHALLCLGKVWRMVTHEPWDCCVVDLPATGHGIGWLEVPRVVTKAIHLGPLRRVGEDLSALIEDPAVTTLLLVTLLEELAVNETLLLVDRLIALRLPWGAVIANAVWPEPRAMGTVPENRDSPHFEALVAATRYLERRNAVQAAERERLLAACLATRVTRPPRAIREIPRYPETGSRELIEVVADRLEALL